MMDNRPAIEFSPSPSPMDETLAGIAVMIERNQESIESVEKRLDEVERMLNDPDEQWGPPHGGLEGLATVLQERSEAISRRYSELMVAEFARYQDRLESISLRHLQGTVMCSIAVILGVFWSMFR